MRHAFTRVRMSIVAAAASAAASAGCGDGPICRSEVMVLIQAPAGVVANDQDDVRPGVQTTVHVRSTLPAGSAVSLRVEDADGTTVTSVDGIAGTDGTASFEGVTVPPGDAIVRVHADGDECGSADDQVTIAVTAGVGCAVTMLPQPAWNAHYEPVPVLNAELDRDPRLPNFQAQIAVASAPSRSVELFVTAAGTEVSAGRRTTGADGTATFDLSLAQGRIALRAVCTSADGLAQAASLTRTVQVDTEAPSCAVTFPAPGSTITPSYDGNDDLGDGIQLVAIGHASAPDVAGARGRFEVTVAGAPQTLPGNLEASGDLRADVSLAPTVTPAEATIAFYAVDHAGNTCSSSATYRMVYDGCDIAVTTPTTTVTADADGDARNGVQLDVALAIAPSCEGRQVESDCGRNDPSAKVPAGGAVSLRVDACASSPCETALDCTFRVTSSDGVETHTAATLRFDDAPPVVSLQLVDPSLGCGAQVTPAADVDPAPGVQVRARVVSAGSIHRELAVTGAAGTTTTDAIGDVMATLAPGANILVAAAEDSVGNRAEAAPCALTLADLTISYAPPAADGRVSGRDGVVQGGRLTLDLCGSVSATGAAVSISVGGAPPQPATITGSTWCRRLSLVEASHVIVVRATAGPSFGSATLVLTVDVTPPPGITDLTGVADTRRSITLGWTSAGPAAAYELRLATAPMTDTDFDTAGALMPLAAPAPPGTRERVPMAPLRPGTSYWVGLATVDTAGNRSRASIVGPLTPSFDQTPAILPPEPVPGMYGLGHAIIHGKLNDDDYDDIAVSAPTQSLLRRNQAGAVYVYFGGPGGIATTPDAVIEGSVASARLGYGLTTVRWSSADRDDLVIGAPFADGQRGRVFVFQGGATFTAGVRADTTAELQIGVHATQPGWFNDALFGFSLATGDFDGDGRDDLLAGATGGGAGRGGVAILYGGTIRGPRVLLSDVEDSGLAGAVVHLVAEPAGVSGRRFGYYLHAVGPTQGASDVTDDILTAYFDDYTNTSDVAYLLRGTTVRPTAGGVYRRPFTAGRDVRIELVTTYPITDFASQVTSIDDQNGDGARDLVIAAYRAFNGAGHVMILDGDAIGTGGVVRTSDPGVMLTSLTGGGSTILGAVVADHAAGGIADVDGDGREDLVVGGNANGQPRLYVWFGGAIPTGSAKFDTAGYVIEGPASMAFNMPPGGGAAGRARWIGDINGDGLADVGWTSVAGNVRDGAFQVLWDQR